MANKTEDRGFLDVEKHASQYCLGLSRRDAKEKQWFASVVARFPQDRAQTGWKCTSRLCPLPCKQRRQLVPSLKDRVADILRLLSAR